MNKVLAWILSAIVAAGAAVYVFQLKTNGDAGTQNVEQGTGQDAESAGTQTQEPIATDAAVETQPTEGATSVSNSDQDQVATPVTIDTVRIDADGYVLIAGQAQLGQAVTAVVDGEDVAQATVENDGNFVLMFELPASDQARVMALRVGDGSDAIYADQDIVIAPSQIVVAKVDDAQQDTQSKTDDAQQENTQVAQDTATPVVDATDVTTPGNGDFVSNSDAVAQAADAAATAMNETTQNADTVQSSETAIVENTSNVSTSENTVVAEATGDQTQQPDMRISSNSAITSTEPNAPSEQTSEGLNVAQTAENITTNVNNVEQSVSKNDQTQQTSLETDKPSSDTAQAEPIQTEQPTVFVADTTGVKVIQSAQEIAAEQVVLDAITYNDQGGVILSGRGATGARTNLYLDNALVLETQADEKGYWNIDGTGIAPGVYTLRIDQLDASGKVSSRFETPFKREDRDTLIAAAKSTTQSQSTETPQANDTVADDQKEATTNGRDIEAITVQPGNTLWGISRKRYGQGMLYVRVFEANRDKIRDPHWIYPGQVFVLPAEDGQN
jgi:nucleoid-associated protein YgaU